LTYKRILEHFETMCEMVSEVVSVVSGDRLGVWVACKVFGMALDK
jgi:hypothetical protein